MRAARRASTRLGEVGGPQAPSPHKVFISPQSERRGPTGGGSPGSLLAQSAGGVDNYFHQDRLGSTANVSDAGAGQTAELKYDPFGGVRSQPAGGSGITFTGQQHDAATGLYYYGARFYDPAVGRFLSEDTWAGAAAGPESLQKFLYANSNPGRFVDPTGHQNLAADQQRNSDTGAAIEFEAPNGSRAFVWDGRPRIVPPTQAEMNQGCRGEQCITINQPPQEAPHAKPVSPGNLPPGYVVRNGDLTRWYGEPPRHAGGSQRATSEDNSAKEVAKVAPRSPAAPPTPVKPGGFWSAAWGGITGGGIGPTSNFGQVLAHGDYGFSLFGHEFKPSAYLQDDNALRQTQNGIIAATAGAEVAIATGGLAAIWGEGTLLGSTYGAAVVGNLAGGIEARSLQVSLNGGGAEAQLQAAFDVNAMGWDAALAIGGTAAMEFGPGIVRGVRGWFGGGRPPSTAPPMVAPAAPFEPVPGAPRLLETSNAANQGTRFGTRVELEFPAKTAEDAQYIRELVEGTNRALVNRPGIVGNQLDFDPKLSNRFLREFFGTRTLREAIQKKVALEASLGRSLAVDEIVPRQLGGPQIFPNQRLIPGSLNSSLGSVEQHALAPLQPGTRVLGFGVTFRP